MPSFAISLLSGGLDSTTVTAYAASRCDKLTALTFRYGQTHSREVQSAELVARALGVEHRTLDISFLRDIAWYSALTNPDAFPMPQDAIEIGAAIPITYVPLRNTIFVSLAAAYLESAVLHAIETEGVDPATIEAVVYMAPNAVDYSGYPDCRPEFYEQAAKTLEMGSKLGASASRRPSSPCPRPISSAWRPGSTPRSTSPGAAMPAASAPAAAAIAASCAKKGSRRQASPTRR